MGPETRIQGLIEPAIEALGHELVRVKFYTGRKPTLQVMIDRRDGAIVTVDDCAEVSRTISAVIDVEDPIDEAYALEVSSPGIDRPLTRRKDFAKYAGFEARLELRIPDDNGRRRFRGRLVGYEEAEDVVVLEPKPAGSGRHDDPSTDAAEIAVRFGDIQSAKLVLTDELIEAAGTPAS